MQDVITFVSNHPALSLSAVLVLVLLMFIELIRARRGIVQINPTQMTQLINHENAVVIDIRPDEAFKNGHIIEAISMKPQEIRENSKKIEKYKIHPVVIICQTGMESQKIAALLLKHGYNAYSLAGGIRSWTEAQMPLVKG